MPEALDREHAIWAERSSGHPNALAQPFPKGLGLRVLKGPRIQIIGFEGPRTKNMNAISALKPYYVGL